MINVEVLINTNGTKEEKENLSIPMDAIEDFLGNGFADKAYEGRVIYRCTSRAIPPNVVEVIIDITDTVGRILTWGTVLKSVISLARAMKGYCVKLLIRYKREKGGVINIPIDDEDYDDINKIEEKIKKELGN